MHLTTTYKVWIVCNKVLFFLLLAASVLYTIVPCMLLSISFNLHTFMLADFYLQISFRAGSSIIFVYTCEKKKSIQPALSKFQEQSGKNAF